MSKIALTPNGSGSGVFTIASPNSNTNRTITLPDESVTLGAGTPSIDDNGNATAITIDSSENVGIGCVPNSIQSNFDTLQIGGNLTLNVDSTGANAGVYMGNNVYRDSTDSRWEYIYTDEASQYYQANGNHVWRTASSGSANAAISWSERMRIDSSGNVGIGTSSPTAKFSVAGSTSGDYLAKLESTNQFGLKIKTTSTSNSHEQLAIHDGNNDVQFKVMGGGNVYATAINLGGTGVANRLNDYEEGTFTPAVENGWGVLNPTYNTRSGYYTKVGNKVYIVFHIILSGGSLNGNKLQLNGFPFSVANTSSAESTLNGFFYTASSQQATPMFVMASNGTTGSFVRRTTTNRTNFTGNDAGNGFNLSFSGTYLTDQ